MSEKSSQLVDGSTTKERIAAARYVAQKYEAQHRPALVRVMQNYIGELQAALKRQDEGQQLLTDGPVEPHTDPNFEPDAPFPYEVPPAAVADVEM